MPNTVESLAKEAFHLPVEQRMELAHRLLSSVDPEPDPGAEAAWEEEIARRIASVDAGEVKRIPAGEVFARLRQIAP